MSKRNACGSGRFIEDLARPLDRPPEIRVLDRLAFQKVDSPPEQILEILQEVEVARLRIKVVTGGGAEEVQSLDPMLEAEAMEFSEPLLDFAVHSVTSIPRITDPSYSSGRNPTSSISFRALTVVATPGRIW